MHEKGLEYSSEHLWVATEGDEATVGLAQYAADMLGDIVFVELPDVGTHVDRGSVFGTIESVKAVSDMFSPIAGTIIAVNDRLEAEPETVNLDPLGEGWMFRMALDAGEGMGGGELMSFADYSAFVADPPEPG